MSKFDFQQPEFLFCEIPIKDGTENDNRMWIYHRLSLSLIEFVEVSSFTDFQFKGKQARFEYECFDGEIEDYFGVFVQNNCEYTDQDENLVLKSCWEYLKNYLKWEDSQ